MAPQPVSTLKSINENEMFGSLRGVAMHRVVKIRAGGGGGGEPGVAGGAGGVATASAAGAGAGAAAPPLRCRFATGDADTSGWSYVTSHQICQRQIRDRDAFEDHSCQHAKQQILEQRAAWSTHA